MLNTREQEDRAQWDRIRASGRVTVAYDCPACGVVLWELVPSTAEEPYTTFVVCPTCEAMHHRTTWADGTVEINDLAGGLHRPATTLTGEPQ